MSESKSTHGLLGTIFVLSAAVLLLLGFFGGSFINGAIACSPGINNCSAPSSVTNIMFGTTVMELYSGTPATATSSGTITVNYYASLADSVKSYTFGYCTAITNGLCPSTTPISLGTANAGQITGQFAFPSAGTFFFQATITFVSGTVSTLVGSIVYGPSVSTGAVVVSPTPEGMTVQFYQGGTSPGNLQGQLNINPQSSGPQSITLPYGVYGWVAMAPGYSLGSGTVTVAGPTVNLPITLQSQSAPPTTTTTTVTGTATSVSTGTAVSSTTVSGTATTYTVTTVVTSGAETCTEVIVYQNGATSTNQVCTWPVVTSTVAVTSSSSTIVSGSVTTSTATSTGSSSSNSGSLSLTQELIIVAGVVLGLVGAVELGRARAE
jgi:hypothetical protein